MGAALIFIPRSKNISQSRAGLCLTSWDLARAWLGWASVQVGWGQGIFCPALAGISESVVFLWTVCGQVAEEVSSGGR